MIRTTTLLLSLILLSPGSSWAQVGDEDKPARPAAGTPSAVDRAKRHYQRGSEAFDVGRFDEAIKELEESYRLSGESVLLFNIAKAYEKLGDLEEAIRHYRDYVDLTGNLSDEDKAEVAKTVQELETKRRDSLPELTIRTRPEGAKVYVDTKARVAGQTPFSDKFEPGEHTLWVELKGFEEVKKEIKLEKGGKPLVLDFELVTIEEFGEIQIVANTSGARIFLDGKNIGITPLGDAQKVKVGKHKVHMERDEYFHYDVEVHVPKGRTALVNAQMTKIEPLSKAPGRLGWTGVILGSVAMVGAVVAGAYANGAFEFAQDRPLYNDTDEFRTFEQTELWSWVGGSVLMAGGITGLIYDGIRVPPQADKPPPEAIPAPVRPELTPPPVPGGPGTPPADATPPAGAAGGAS